MQRKSHKNNKFQAKKKKNEKTTKNTKKYFSANDSNFRFLQSFNNKNKYKEKKKKGRRKTDLKAVSARISPNYQASQPAKQSEARRTQQTTGRFYNVKLETQGKLNRKN